MTIREIQGFTRKSIQGHYAAVLTASLLYPALRVLFHLLPCFLAAVVIACGGMTQRELLLGGVPLWAVLTVLWELLAFCILTPVRCGVYSWLSDFLGLGSGEEDVFFRSVGAYFRGLGFFAGVALCRMLALVPFMLFAGGAVVCFRVSLTMQDGGLPLFLGVQCILGAAWTGLYYLRFCLEIAAVPFLFLANPRLSPFRAVQQSRRLLRGSVRLLLGIWLRWLPPALPGVTIPFLLPYPMMQSTLLIQIRIREWLQEEQHHAHTAIPRRTRRTLLAGKLPAA